MILTLVSKLIAYCVVSKPSAEQEDGQDKYWISRMVASQVANIVNSAIIILFWAAINYYFRPEVCIASFLQSGAITIFLTLYLLLFIHNLSSFSSSSMGELRRMDMPTIEKGMRLIIPTYVTVKMERDFLASHIRGYSLGAGLILIGFGALNLPSHSFLGGVFYFLCFKELISMSFFADAIGHYDVTYLVFTARERALVNSDGEKEEFKNSEEVINQGAFAKMQQGTMCKPLEGGGIQRRLVVRKIFCSGTGGQNGLGGAATPAMCVAELRALLEISRPACQEGGGGQKHLPTILDFTAGLSGEYSITMNYCGRPLFGGGGMISVAGDLYLNPDSLEGGGIQSIINEKNWNEKGSQNRGASLWGAMEAIMGGTLKALKFLHERRFWHLDFKPDNIVIDWDPRAGEGGGFVAVLVDINGNFKDLGTLAATHCHPDMQTNDQRQIDIPWIGYCKMFESLGALPVDPEGIFWREKPFDQIATWDVYGWYIAMHEILATMARDYVYYVRRLPGSLALIYHKVKKSTDPRENMSKSPDYYQSDQDFTASFFEDTSEAFTKDVFTEGCAGRGNYVNSSLLLKKAGGNVFASDWNDRPTIDGLLKSWDQFSA
jgi:hypothetical protein